MSKETFAVGCGGIGFHNGVVMIDFTGLSATEKDAEGRPAKEMRQRIIMTPDALLETFNNIQGMINKLVEVGVLKKNETPPPAMTPQ
ncbi:MAG: hypothetical protein V1806_08525 [Pseudomonadota bacterium]